MSKILVVEDDPATSHLVKEFLAQKGHTVDLAATATDALAFIDTYPYNVIVMDWQLEDGSTGIQVLKEYRQKGGTAPVLMMTSRGALEDKQVGFDAGADDYLLKPFHAKELIMRVEALLRRAPTSMSSNEIGSGRITVDTVKRCAHADGKDLMLRPKEFALLEHFLRHPNFVFSTEALLSAVWPSDEEPSDLAVRVTIKRLRQRINEAIGIDPIETVHGMGYKFITPEQK